MKNTLQKLADCIEFGKINKAAPFPPQMKGEDGADELTRQALADGVESQEILSDALMVGMIRVGIKFRENKIFVPQVLMSAKAMSKSMIHLKPYFDSGKAKQKGTFIIGTVTGDLHDIGKNLVAMMIEGNGYKVIDLGTDVNAEKFLEKLEQYPDASVGLSALLTTTMVNMENITKKIKEKYANTLVTIGGAPVNNDFCQKIGADFYAPDPQGVVEFLNQKVA